MTTMIITIGAVRNAADSPYPEVWIAAGVVTAIIVGLVCFRTTGLIYSFVPRKWMTVRGGELYRSGQLSPRLVKRMLHKHRIQMVVDLTHFRSTRKAHLAEAQAIEELQIEGARFPMSGDGTGTVEHYAGALAAIKKARDEGKAVLVHCTAGAQRTGGVIAMYLLLLEGRSIEQAQAELIRAMGEPPSDVLVNFLNDNAMAIARRLVEMGVMDRVPAPLPRFARQRSRSTTSPS